jgi:hypothetical protein
MPKRDLVAEASKKAKNLNVEYIKSKYQWRLFKKNNINYFYYE